MPPSAIFLPATRPRVVTALAAVGATVAGLLAGATVLAPGAAAASAFTPDDVVVYRVGTGSAALSSSATAAFLDEYSPTGGAVQSIALPTAASGNTKILTSSGTATSEGLLSLSPDGRFLTAAGYAAAVGTASVSGSASTSVPRTVAVAGVGGTVDTSTSLTDAVSGNNPRSAATVDGTGVWIAGGAGGIRYAAKGATTSNAVSDTAATTNFRQVQVAGGQLYASSQSGSTRVAAIGSGTPTTAGQAVTNLPGAISSSTSPNNNPYQVAFLTLGTGTTPDTAYVADQTAGAVQKYSLVGGSWTLTGSVTGVGAVTGVAANVYGGAVRIYATNPTSLFRFSDGSGKGGTLSGSPGTAIATAATNTAFRGVSFAPGTTLSGGTTTPAVGAPTIGAAQTALAAALGDSTNPTITVTVAVGTNATYGVNALSVTASSSNSAVAATDGISVSGSGATRTVTVTPKAVGTSTVTLTVTAPDGRTGTTAFTYGVSADQGDASDRYLAGAGNASATVDVGGGYLLVGDDESNVIRLYDASRSGLPVATFDFTAQFPSGSSEIDIEGAARSGNTIYWMGSMSNNSSGNVAPARSTVFATTVSGSGANTSLAWAGANTTLRADLVAWDKDNGHGLGANYFGLDNSVNGGTSGHTVDSLNLEGLEFAKGSSTTAYLAFRSPIVPANNRTKALVVPVTNFSSLVSSTSPTATHGTFGAPLQWDLNGLGVRDLKANDAGTFLVVAGTADGSNSPSVLYTWDGVPADPPLPGQTLPDLPAGSPAGWEAVTAVPADLSAGSAFTLVQDNGETAWYGDGQTSKNGLALPLQKDLARTFSYTAPHRLASSTTLRTSDDDVSANEQFTLTATVTTGDSAVTGPVDFLVGEVTVDGCDDVAPVNGTATCTTGVDRPGGYTFTAKYAGDAFSAVSVSNPVRVTVEAIPVTVTAQDQSTTFGSPDPTFTYTVDPSITFTSPPRCGVDGEHTAVGRYPITCSGAQASSSYDIRYVAGTLTVMKATPTLTLTADPAAPVATQSVALTATVASEAGTPTGTVAFRADNDPVPGCEAVAVDADGAATCAVPAGFAAGRHPVVARYSGDDTFTTAADAIVLTVARADAAVAVTGDPATPVSGQAVTVTAQVTSPTATATATGTVTFSAAGQVLAGCADVALDPTGTADCTVPDGFAAGSVALAAAYSGDDVLLAAEGDTTVSVDPADTSVSVAADEDTLVTGQSVTFTAAVSVDAPGTTAAATPGGTVRFLFGGGRTVDGCSAVALGADLAAQCTVADGFAPPSAQVRAVYSGDADFAPSNSAVLTVEVDRAQVQVAVSSSVDMPVSGQPVTYTAVVGARAPGAGTPTGQVTFTVTDANGRRIGCPAGNTVALRNASAPCDVPGNQVAGNGRLSVTVNYTGDDGFAPGSGSLAQSVSRASTTTTIRSTVATPVTGQAVSLFADVAVTAPGGGRPTGTVTFEVVGTDGTRISCTGGNTATVNRSGTARCDIAAGVLSAASAPYAVTARYSGKPQLFASRGTLDLPVAKATGTVQVGQSSASTRQGTPFTVTVQVGSATTSPNPYGGTVTVTVTGADGTTVPCTGAGTPDANGRASCTVAGSGLTAANSPYTVVGAWSGDDDVTGAKASKTHRVTS